MKDEEWGFACHLLARASGRERHLERSEAGERRERSSSSPEADVPQCESARSDVLPTNGEEGPGALRAE